MRQLLIIASVVSLFMYTGFVLQHDRAVATYASDGSLGGLQRALDATGASLDRAVISGWVDVEDARAQAQVVGALGWKPGSEAKDEAREAAIHRRQGAQYLTLRWVLSGEAAQGWHDRQARVREALALAGKRPHVTVQLEGTTARAGLEALGHRALDAVGAVERQPWSGPRASSVAGRTDDLPPSTFGVNVQVALRQTADAGRTRVWVAWPALLQEY